MTEYEVHTETVTGSYEENMTDAEEIVGTVDIPADAVGVNTVAIEPSPPIITVSWLEPVAGQGQ